MAKDIPQEEKTFRFIEPEELLRRTGPNMWEHKGKPLDPAIVSQIKDEARIFLKGRLWNIMKSELKYHAFIRLLEKGETTNDILAAKMLTYLADVVDTKIKELLK